MRDLVSPRSGLRFVLLAATALAMTGCADSSRFADPFGSPFASSESVDRAPTGSVPAPRRAPEKIVGQPLAPAPQAASLAPTPAPAPAPVAPTPHAPVAASSNWTAQGGTPVVLAQGETANTLADRYGVPLDALVRTNGFSSAGQIKPGAKLVIPVYSVGASKSAAAMPAREPAAEKAKPQPLAREAKEAPRKETLKLVKGPQPKAARHDDADEKPAAKKAQASGKAKLLERTKSARAKKDDEDDAPAAKTKKPSPQAREEAVKPQKPSPKVAREEPVKEKPAKIARIEPQPSPKVSREEVVKPEKPAKIARVEPAPDKKPAIDTAPTATLPPAESAKAEKSAEASAPEFRWPARGRVIQGFKSGGNDGINIAVPEGTAVKAAEDGVVAYAGSELKGYGNLVLIRHPNGFVSAYANNGSLDVKRGESVKRGQTIAKSGQTGNVSSPQLHFELRKGAQPVDPATYLAGN
jgi:murein DD-endopeptidase MepM/ murein hydrolase activator NlpD